MGVPDIFKPTEWVGTTCIDEAKQHLGITFVTAANERKRFLLTVENAERLVDSIRWAMDYAKSSQSSTSSDSPAVEGSMSSGQKVSPLASA